MVSRNIIENVFDDVISNFNGKCSHEGATSSSGVIYGKGEKPKYELIDGGLTKELLNTIADDMAERWGLEVSIDSKGNREVSKTKFSLWDDNHKTLIRLNKMIKHQDWIDFTNGNGMFSSSYTLDDVLRYYNDLPELAKTRMGAVLFETTSGSSFNRMYHGTYGIANTIEISDMCYGNNGTNVPSQYHLKQVMGHEAGHAMERILTNEQINVLEKSHVKGSVNKFKESQLDTDRERQIYRNLLHGNDGEARDLSSSKEWEEARNKNNVAMSSQYASSYDFSSDRNSEDVAETMSAVAFRNASNEEKQTFRIRYVGGKEVDYDTFVKDHEATFKLACDYVDGKVTHDSLHY